MNRYTANTTETAELPEYLAAEMADHIKGTAIKRGKHWVIEADEGFVTNEYADHLGQEMYGG